MAMAINPIACYLLANKQAWQKRAKHMSKAQQAKAKILATSTTQQKRSISRSELIAMNRRRKAKAANAKHRRALVKMKTDFAAKRERRIMTRGEFDKRVALIKGKATRAIKAALSAEEFAIYQGGVTHAAQQLAAAKKGHRIW